MVGGVRGGVLACPALAPVLTTTAACDEVRMRRAVSARARLCQRASMRRSSRKTTSSVAKAMPHTEAATPVIRPR